MKRLFSSLTLIAIMTHAYQAFASQQLPSLRIAYKADFLSMDPHAIAEASQLDVLNNIYEPLVSTDEQGNITPALAQSWEQRSDTSWRFHLQPGTRFDGGETFSSQDVVFSFNRAVGTESGVRVFVSPIERIEVVDALTVDIVLRERQPNFLRSLSGWYMLSADWCNIHDCQLGHADAYTLTHANGTGPYRLVERQPGIVSIFERNPHYRATQAVSYGRIEFRPIVDDTERSNALLLKQVDAINPLPLSALNAAGSDPALQIIKRPDARVLFLGMDVQRGELRYSSVKGHNPLRDVRVRRAIYQGIDMDKIQRTVMLNTSRNTGILIPDNAFGYDVSVDRRLPYDAEAARRLLQAAGYQNGFSLKLNCPNDRYVNDEALCRAIAADLAKIGVRIELDIETKSKFFSKVLNGDTSFYLLGAGTNTGDGLSILGPVVGSKSDGERGELNIGAYSNPRVDELLALAGPETDPQKRAQYYREISELNREDVGHIPLLQQYVVWGVRKGIHLVFMPENGIPWKYITHDDTGAD